MAPRWSCVVAGLAAVALQAPLAAAQAGISAADIQKILNKHNQYRCMHNVTLMTWDATVAANAQAWANQGNWGHSSGASRVVNGVQCGENIAWGFPTMAADQAVFEWYSEIDYTSPYGLAKSFTDSTDPTESIGHYTQVVWKSSVKLGCGVGRATIQGSTGDFWVCQYSPAGNYDGQFTANVLAPVRNATQCANATVSGDTTTTMIPGGATTTTLRGTSVSQTATATPPPPPGNPGCGLLAATAVADFERGTGMVLRRCQGSPLMPAGAAMSPSPGYASPSPIYYAPSPSYSQSPPPNQTNGSNSTPPPNATNASNGSNASPPVAPPPPR